MVNAAVCASQYMVAAARQGGRDELWPAKRDLRREIGFCLEFSRGIAVGVACLFLANMKRMGRRAGGLQRVVCDIAIEKIWHGRGAMHAATKVPWFIQNNAIRRQKIFAPTTRAFGCKKRNDCAALVMCVPWRSEL